MAKRSSDGAYKAKSAAMAAFIFGEESSSEDEGVELGEQGPSTAFTGPARALLDNYVMR